MYLRRICLFILFSLFLAGGRTEARAKESLPVPYFCQTQGWPQDRSDLKPDPAMMFGSLKNGLRYVILPNSEPKGRVSLQLKIHAGSLHESEEQRGTAHYLEHMMFNGTAHYPPGKLVDYFQSIGMSFGPDTNAHTTYDETVYQLMLPNSAKATISEGLRVLADYAGGALLLPDEVNRERGVILAEKRERDSAGQRVFKADMEQGFADTLLARRDVIGVEETLKKADAVSLRQFYETWYRPENMLLAVVGDVEPALLNELIAEQFSPLKVKKEQAACPELGKLPKGGVAAFYQHEPDLGHAKITIGSAWNTESEHFTQAAALRGLKEAVASTVFNYRLQRLANSKDSPLTSAQFHSGRLFGRFGFSSLSAKADDDQWQTVLNLLNTALRQALAADFAEAELARAKKEIMSLLKQQLESAASRKSDTLAAELLSTLNEGEVPLSPAQEMELYGPALEKLTAAEVSAVFRSLWPERRLIKVAGTADLSGKEQKPEELLLAAFTTAQTAELAPWTQQAEAVFPYLPPPTAKAKVERRAALEKIGAEQVLFSNGLTLNLKKTGFEPNEVQVSVVFGKGELSEPKPGLALLAQMLLPESGTGGLDQDQLKAALAQYSIRAQFRVDEDSFQFNGQGLSSEIETLFQLLHAHLHDPAFRADAFDRVMRKAEQMHAQMAGSVEGMMQIKGEPFLAGGNLRYGIAPLEMMKARTLEELKAWLAPVLKDEPLEISVVGDFDPEQAVKLAGKYFGGQRTGRQQAAGGKIVFPSGQNLTLNVITASDKAMITVAWPTDDFWDIARTRRLSVLAAVLDDRLRKQVREELGDAYSPYVYNRSSTVDPGYGVLRSVVLAEPGQAAQLAGKLKQAGKELAAGKISADELTRAVEPTLTSVRDMVRTNRYWLESVLVKSSRHPQRLEWPLSIESDFAAVKAEELEALAAKYLQPDKAAEVILLPARN
ncbi:M16 family metallopeptidase [Candidatus Electronema sp. TJ]|uniref:M16 family metallopeptidase n=1 Tax=Candidatus Electronema sp. TJ TaxID=3401573 RepID=UPI003AA9656C